LRTVAVRKDVFIGSEAMPGDEGIQRDPALRLRMVGDLPIPRSPTASAHHNGFLLYADSHRRHSQVHHLYRRLEKSGTRKFPRLTWWERPLARYLGEGSALALGLLRGARRIAV